MHVIDCRVTAVSCPLHSEADGSTLMLDGGADYSNGSGYNGSGCSGSDCNGSSYSEHHDKMGHVGRYQVFRFDFLSVRGAFVVSLWILAASLAKIGKHPLPRRISLYMPYTCHKL